MAARHMKGSVQDPGSTDRLRTPSVPAKPKDEGLDSLTTLTVDDPYSYGGFGYAEEPQRMHPVLRVLLFLILVAAGVALDQFSKTWARDALANNLHLDVLPGFFEFYLVKNTGAAFSIGQGMGWLFVVVAIVVSILALVYVARSRNMGFFGIFFIACVAAGGIGNLIDRLRFGYVTDFIAPTFIDFPVFNVADILVCVGVFCSLIYFIAEDARESRGSRRR